MGKRTTGRKWPTGIGGLKKVENAGWNIEYHSSNPNNCFMQEMSSLDLFSSSDKFWANEFEVSRFISSGTIFHKEGVASKRGSNCKARAI